MSDADTTKRTSRLHGFLKALRGESMAPGAPNTATHAAPSERPGGERASLHPPRDSGAGTGRMSSAGIGERISRTWDPEEWEEDQRYVDAMDLYASGQKRGAMTRLDLLFQDDPSHLHGRLQLFAIAVELKDRDVAAKHADWVIEHYVQQRKLQNVCESYRSARMAFPDLQWAEKSLVQAMLSGEKVEDARVVVDATKLLIHTYPQSPALPRAMLAGAKVQEQEGRPDLARITLQNIIASYPLDPIAELAKRRLDEMT